MKKHLFTSVLFILLYAFSIAQSNKGFGVQLRVGQTGDHINVQPTYESFETSHSAKSGLSWAAGINYRFFYGKYAGLKFGALYEQDEFTRIEEYQYQSFQNINRGGEITRQYANRSILMPFQCFWQFNKVGFSASLIYNYHLKTKMENEHIFFEEGTEAFRSKETVQSGEFVDYGFGDWEKIDLEKKLDTQWAVGVYFQITPNLILDVEYKDYIGKNLLVQEIKNYDVIGTFERTNDPFARNVSLGVNWLIKNK